MKKYVTSIVLLLLLQQLSAFNLFDQLCAFNFNWKKYEGNIPVQQARFFNSDKEYVQAHLSTALTVLRTNPVNQLTAQQYESRLHLIALLDGYCKAGNFPINFIRSQRIPVFIDRNNTHCAVGFLLQQTGNEEVAVRIAATNNYAWVKDIGDEGLIAWQKKSGLTLEELKLVQGAYEFYMPNAFILPNKYEIPQKPVCITAYFKDVKGRAQTKGFAWCHGEGTNGILNGRWEQNYAIDLPWIVGYFDNGKRTGQWMEYYQGTKLLCRTENWRDDKLNGVRKRFDRSGNMIEVILFKDGKAVTKTNYDLEQSLTWVRRPIDLTLVWTEVYTTGGALLANGHETVYNPGNLLWFQNIELTALNSHAISSREVTLSNGINNAPGRITSFGKPALYNTLPLVQYNKEGDWTYYKDYEIYGPLTRSSNLLRDFFSSRFRYFGTAIFNAVQQFDDLKITTGYDSIKIVYSKNQVKDFYGYGKTAYAHLQIRYHPLHKIAAFSPLVKQRMALQTPLIMECGQYNLEHQKIGTWKHYDSRGILYKTENFILPQKEQNEMEELRTVLQANPVWRKELVDENWQVGIIDK